MRKHVHVDRVCWGQPRPYLYTTTQREPAGASVADVPCARLGSVVGAVETARAREARGHGRIQSARMHRPQREKGQG
jgi:hypothetical protein